MIPKVFNWVWLGPAPLPEKDREWIHTWISCHPGWSFRLWTDDIEACHLKGMQPATDKLILREIPPLINYEWYDNIEELISGRAAIAARSDIVRLEIIARYGGIYLDTDVECFQHIGPLMEGVELFIADEWRPAPGNYMFGARPNHPAMWTCVRELGHHLDKMRDEKGKVNAVFGAGPHYIGPQLRKYGQELVIFPWQLFNPMCAHDDPLKATHWPKCAYGNHHYAGKWYDRVKRGVMPPQFQGERHQEHFEPRQLT